MSRMTIVPKLRLPGELGGQFAGLRSLIQAVRRVVRNLESEFTFDQLHQYVYPQLLRNPSLGLYETVNRIYHIWKLRPTGMNCDVWESAVIINC